VRFLYDRFDVGNGTNRPDRYVSDFESHVYYPRELQLLFRLTGFEVAAVFGDYRFGPLRPTSRDIVMVGQKRAV
jgi:hypothetical protein